MKLYLHSHPLQDIDLQLQLDTGNVVMELVSVQYTLHDMASIEMENYLIRYME